MTRFLAAKPDAALIPLPWNLPLEQWPEERLVALPRGISRHIVRFIRVGDEVYAAKELIEPLAIHEYRLLRELKSMDIPSVEPVGVVTGRTSDSGKPLDPVLLTRHLPFSLPYRSLFNPGIRIETVVRLIDALVVLLVRLHLQGFLWGDVSLSNVLFLRDAGEFAAYLVDAETGELHNSLSDGQRAHDLQIARTNLFGEFCDLETGGLLDDSLDPLTLVENIGERYDELWHELTGVEEFSGSELERIEGRVRRLNAIGFDVAELDIHTSEDGSWIRIQPKVVDAGHHTRRLMRLTGLDVEENQARRLLNDLDTFRVRTGQQNVDEAVVAHQWLTECFESVVNRIPPELSGKRDAAQLFHEVLDYRWYKSQNENREIGLQESTEGYITDVLTQLPEERVSEDALTQMAENGRELANPYDPSQGYAHEPYDKPYDPWEENMPEIDVEAELALNIDKIRAKKKKKKKKKKDKKKASKDSTAEYES